MPLSAAVCAAASVAIVKVPVRAPETVGVKAMETVQPVCAASEVPQVLPLMLKSPVIVAARSPPLLVPVLLTV